MMETLMHTIGVCPDRMSHIDLIDVFTIFGFVVASTWLFLKSYISIVFELIKSKFKK